MPEHESPASEEWFSAETSTFGDRVAGAREAQGMSQKDLAKRLGVKLKTVRGWENDLSEPRANKLSMLAGLLNVSITWLLNAEGDGPEAPEDAQPLSPDVNDLLTELRALKGQMGDMTDRVGLLEKRLRAKLKEEA